MKKLHCLGALTLSVLTSVAFAAPTNIEFQVTTSVPEIFQVKGLGENNKIQPINFFGSGQAIKNNSTKAYIHSNIAGIEVDLKLKSAPTLRHVDGGSEIKLAVSANIANGGNKPLTTGNATRFSNKDLNFGVKKDQPMQSELLSFSVMPDDRDYRNAAAGSYTGTLTIEVTQSTKSA